MEHEVVVRLDGLPRPATLLERRGEQVNVRVRDAGGYAERWVRASDVPEVESSRRPSYLKVVGWPRLRCRACCVRRGPAAPTVAWATWPRPRPPTPPAS